MLRRDTFRADFEAACRTVATNLSKTGTEVRVVFAGSGAAADSTNTIYLPAGDGTKMLTQKQQGVMAGFLDHEAAHLLYTDMQVWNEQCAIVSPWVRNMANAIEDMRIERQMMRNWAGSRANLSEVSQQVNEETLAAHSKDIASRSTRQIVATAVTWEGRGRLGLHPDSNERLLDLTSGEVKALASSICDRIHDLPDGKAGTLAAFDLAREFDALTKLPKPPVADDPTKPDEEQPSDAEPTATGEPSTGESDDTASDESTNTKEADQPETTESDDATNDAEELSDDKLLELLEEAYGDDDGDEQQLEVSSRPKMLDDIGDETAKGGWLNLLSEPVFHHRTMPALCDYRGKDITQRSQMTRESGDANFQQTLDKMRGQLPTMRAKLRRALVTKQERTWLSGTKSGRFDGRRIVQATLGAEDVYMLRQDGTDIDTALSVVIDCSGSMQYGGKDRLARDTAIAIASALEGTGVAYEVVGFTNLHTYLTKDEQKMLDALIPSELTTHGAADRVHIYEFKRFDEPLRDARRAIGNTMEMIHHQNNDADSLLAVWSRLKKRQESRKLMIVLSDGEPAFDSYNIRKAGKIEEHMLNTIALIEGAGCGVIGIGIDSSCVSKFYKKHEVINSLNDLPVRVIDNVAKMLLGDAFVTDNSKLRRVS